MSGQKDAWSSESSALNRHDEQPLEPRIFQVFHLYVATRISGVSVTAELIEFEMKQLAWSL